MIKGDPLDLNAWSGVPGHLAGGLEELGCEIVPVNSEIPRGGLVARLSRRSWAELAASDLAASISGLTADLRLRRVGRVDGIVAMGTGYTLRTRAPFVTFEDMTVAQAVREGGAAYETLSSRQIAGWKGRQRRVYEAARGCCVGSQWTGRSVRDDYGIPESKVHVVGFGHNVEMEKPSRNWETPHFIWVGVDWQRKNGDAVLEAFRRVRERYPEATLDLVGNHPPVDADGVAGHGKLALGSPEGQREYRELLRKATCFVMPSANEPLGIAYIDAANAGLPSIGTTSGGASDVVAGGGRVVDPSDRAALFEAMLELCDPDTARDLGDRARARSELYTWRAVAERIVRVLNPASVDVSSLAADISPMVDAPRDGLGAA